MFVLFSAVGRFAGNGYVSADIVHIFRLFLSVGVSLILLFSAVRCCLFLKVLPLVFCVVAVFLVEVCSQTSLVCGSLFCKRRVFSVCLLQLKRWSVMLVWVVASWALLG